MFWKLSSLSLTPLYKVGPSWPGVVKQQGEENSSMLGIPKGGIHNMTKMQDVVYVLLNCKAALPVRVA